ncbi:hypothetical protein FCM35_KLT09403 [Carex littledalei]|uniref:Uncharacterized protein n=1 Tax=Carex littledalei TaxID=544730 RepID=A0A833W210_9POAL|nr:hypothetical protein FCM35_KLT09403 [Carex littledalei]
MAEAEIVVDVEDEASHLSKSMQRKLDTLWGEPNETNNFTIFHTPRNVHQSKENLFEPSVISIGPFHRGQTSLRTMEEKKWRFLRDFLSRGDHIISLDLCISEMKLLEERTRRCYSVTVDLDSNGFVEMMLLDGCFVLEYFLKLKEQRLNSIFEVGWNSIFIYSDLLLLENQIPFFVVEKLYEIGVKVKQLEDRRNFVDDLFGILTHGPTYYPIIPNPPPEIHHLVHLYHHCSVPDPGKPVVSSSKSFYFTRMLSPSRIKYLLLGFLLLVLPRRFPGFTVTSQSSSLAFPNPIWYRLVYAIPCASELQDAGIKFRPKRNPRHMLDISFDDGVLEIPRQVISGTTKHVLANLIAFEQSKHGQMRAHLTCFAVFFNLLVNTQKDVMILQQCGILQNSLSGEEELTNFFNQVTKGAAIKSHDDHFLAELFTEVNGYCESRWNRQRATLIRDYFSSPWATISFVAALVLLVLTCVQSFFAVYTYFVPLRP